MCKVNRDRNFSLKQVNYESLKVFFNFQTTSSHSFYTINWILLSLSDRLDCVFIHPIVKHMPNFVKCDCRSEKAMSDHTSISQSPLEVVWRSLFCSFWCMPHDILMSLSSLYLVHLYVGTTNTYVIKILTFHDYVVPN